MWKLCKLLKNVRYSKSLCGVPQAKTVLTTEKKNDDEDENDKTCSLSSAARKDRQVFLSSTMARLQNNSIFSTNNTTNNQFTNVFNVLLTASAFAYLLHNPRPFAETTVRFKNTETSTQTDSNQIKPNDFDLSKTEESADFLTAHDHVVGSFKNMLGLDLLKRHLYTEAYEHFKQAVRLHHHPSATYNLGMCFYKGYGVERDEREAVKLWKKAADNGHHLAKYQTAVGHLRGLGNLEKDEKLARRYLKSAVTSNETPLVEACTLYGALLYKTGELEMADMYLKKAQDLSSPVADQLLRNLHKDQSHCD